MSAEEIKLALSRLSTLVDQLQTGAIRAERQLEEVEATLERVSAERDSYKENAYENARLAEAAEKELAAFKARVQEFIQ